MAHKLTDAQAVALGVMAALAPGYVDTSTCTRLDHRQVNGAVARRLEAAGLATSREELPDGSVVTGADLVRLLGHWKTKFTITDAGRAALRAAVST